MTAIMLNKQMNHMYLSKRIRDGLDDWQHHCRRGGVRNQHREDPRDAHEPHEDERLIIPNGLKSKVPNHKIFI